MTIETQFKTGSANIFADLGLPNPEELLVKAELTRQISNLIEGKHLSHQQAAELLNVDKVTIANLLKGRLGDFSIDRLIHFCEIIDNATK